MASWIAAATSYANRGVPMVPFFTFYSMFGFQRVGDSIWSAADSRARGFLLGGTAGRTTLLGEGLQHQDGHSLLLASTVPVCQAYDPAFAYEVAAIIRDGLHRMYVDGEDIFYYLTIYNENYVQPAKPEGRTKASSRVCTVLRTDPTVVPTRQRSCSRARPMRRPVRHSTNSSSTMAWLPICGAPPATRGSAKMRSRWSAGTDCTPARNHATRLLLRHSGGGGPVVAVSDYMKIVPDQVGRWIPRRFITLGTDGFGRSDTREALRRSSRSIPGTLLWRVVGSRCGRRCGIKRGQRCYQAIRNRHRSRQPIRRDRPRAKFGGMAALFSFTEVARHRGRPLSERGDMRPFPRPLSRWSPASRDRARQACSDYATGSTCPRRATLSSRDRI